MSYFIANLSLNLLVKEFLKSMNNLAKLQAKWLIVSHIPFARVVEFGTVQSDFVASRVWSCRFSKFHCTDPRTLSAARPDQTDVHVEIEQTSLRPDKVRGLVGDPSGPWVWSGRVRVVESRSDTIRPDQRQSLVGPVWKNVDISGQRRRYA